MGKPVDSVPEGVVSQWNREHVEAKRSRSLEQVMREFDTIHARLVQEIESIPEGELVYKEDIAEWLVGNTTEHYAEHRRALEAVMSAQRGSHREEVE